MNLYKDMWHKQEALDEDGKSINEGDIVKSTIDFFHPIERSDILIDAGERITVDRIDGNELYFEGIPDHYGGFESHYFKLVKRTKKTNKQLEAIRKRLADNFAKDEVSIPFHLDTYGEAHGEDWAIRHRRK